MTAIDGMPDPKLHRLCRRCQRWFEPEAGSVLGPELTGPYGMLDKPRFQCRRCTNIRRRTEAGLWLLLGAVVGLVFLLVKVGILQ